MQQASRLINCFIKLIGNYNQIILVAIDSKYFIEEELV